MLIEDCSLAVEEGSASSTPQPTRFLARQPILNQRGDVVAYELLSRQGWENWFNGEPEEATRKTLDHCLYMGFEALTNKGLAFVHCTRDSLVRRLVTLLPPDTTVLEVLEPGDPDTELVGACVELRKMGYRLALDDFLPRPELQPLIEIADYIKVDFRATDAYMRRQIHRMMRYSGAALIAEKVEDRHQFSIAREENYQYFQGYYFCRPEIIASHEIPPNRLNYLRLMVELTRKPLNFDEVTRIIAMEASLCYRLLRLANSTQWGIHGDITSVRGALMLVGEDRFRLLMSVATSCALGQDQPIALISLSLERARFCELMAPLIGENPSEQFMLGMLSLMDAMLEMPMTSIAHSLPLRKEAKAALLGASNQVAIPLCLIRSFESGAWDICKGTANVLGVSEETLSRLYVESVLWATESLAASR